MAFGTFCRRVPDPSGSLSGSVRNGVLVPFYCVENELLKLKGKLMNSKWIKTAAILAVLALVVWLPKLLLILVAINLAVSLLVLGLQVVLVGLPRKKMEQRSLEGEQPFVSIHVPAHNEPPELLKETLRGLSELDWDNYEVMIIDNNTTDKSLWQPIAEYCEELGPKFRFFHQENMKGFKSGAMNYIRQFMDKRTEFVFVIDADYVVTPDAIQRGLGYFTDKQVGMVQFPQNYRNQCMGNRGVTMDFKHFFSSYMNMANRLNCVPSTGTLSFLRVEVLQAVHGFSTNVITEDADLGLRLALKGYRSVYAHEVIGSGVMPHDLPSLKKQRWRWAFGNAQILKLNGRKILTTPLLSATQKLGFFAHLTAWFNFNLIPTLSLILFVPLLLTNHLQPEHLYIVLLSGFTLVAWLGLRFLVFCFGLGRDGHSFKDIMAGFLTHVGMGWIYSSSWLSCLLDHRAGFVRTNKFLTEKVPDALRATLTETLLGVALIVAFVLFVVEGFFIAPLAALLIGISRFAILWVSKQMRRTFELTRKVEAAEARARKQEAADVFALESRTTG